MEHHPLATVDQSLCHCFHTTPQQPRKSFFAFSVPSAPKTSTFVAPIDFRRVSAVVASERHQKRCCFVCRCVLLGVGGPPKRTMDVTVTGRCAQRRCFRRGSRMRKRLIEPNRIERRTKRQLFIIAFLGIDSVPPSAMYNDSLLNVMSSILL